jgi:outer membrane PBP1 activator LpoA protein
MKNGRFLFTLIALGGFLLGGCASGNFGDYPGSQSEQRAERLSAEARHDEAAALYIGLATGVQGDERDRLTLLAVEQWLDAGDGRRAKSALRDVDMPDGGELLRLWSADAAALALWEGRPDDAMTLLEPLSQQALPPRERLRVEALRADAWFQLDEPARAVQLYIQRENWLDDRRSIEQNRQRLWAGLAVSDAQELRSAALTSVDPLVNGWLSLGVLAVSTGQQGIGWSNGVIRWQEAHLEHPATVILADLALPERELMDYPRQIGLLLPLSGSNASAGKAIQNGFFGAYFSAAAELGDEQVVRVYDAIGPGGAAAAYARAVEDGVEFVVGPLLRSNVSQLGSAGLLPVPVLTLNYLPDNIEAPTGMYQFALAPEDEARSAASRALAEGALQAVALYPNNDWGRRVAAGFADEFSTGGGRLLAHRSYQPSGQDFSIEIEGLMGLTQSVQRYQRLRANIGGPLQFDPRRRQDVDAVFLAADAKAGRLIKSQLKFHYSGELPVFSTSFVYSMDGRSDTDLNGVMFADTPWTVAPPAWIAEFPELYNEFWPGEKRLARLHAMGYDAYHLVAALFTSGGSLQDEIVGATGRLYLGSDGRVHRKLAWGQFQRGQVVALPEIEQVETTTDPFQSDYPSGDQPWQNQQPNP